MSNKDEQGFTIKDRRSSQSSDEGGKAAEHNPETCKDHDHSHEELPPFELNFSTFVLSLTSSAFYHLGEMPDPQTGETHVELAAVRQTIDILVMLKEKTRGNLTADETKLLDHLIYELQMKFVAKNK